MIRALLLAAALLAATAQAADAETLKIGGQRAVITSPDAPTDRAVVIFHGSGENAVTGQDGWTVRIVRELLPAGYTVASSDAHLQAWGNKASVKDYRALIAELKSRGLTRIYFLAVSMGGLPALQLVDSIKPEAVVGIYPACNMKAIYQRGQYAEKISRAFGVKWTGKLDWPKVEMKTGRNLSPIDPKNVRGMPVAFWASPGDRDVPKATNTDVCAANMKRRGAVVTVNSSTGKHGDESNFDPPKVLETFAAAG